MYSENIMKYFSFDHLPPHLQDVSRNFFNLANYVEKTMPNCSQKNLALQKILEAKDCAVRCNVK